MRGSDRLSLTKDLRWPAQTALLLLVGAHALAAFGCDANSGRAAIGPSGGGGNAGGGGSDGGAGGGRGGGAGGGGGGAIVGADGCVEVQVWPSVSGAARTYYTHRTWDGAQRVLSQESSTTPTFTGRVGLAWRYTDDGRVIAYAGFARDAADMYGNFQHDYVYDDHDNPTDFRLSYPGQPDLAVPSTASTWIGSAYANKYEGDRLSSSTRTPYGAGAGSIRVEQRVFHEDAAGRCDRVETNAPDGTPLWLETRAYDDTGRLSRIDTRSVDPSTTLRCSMRTVVNTYDVDGNITEVRTWCGGDITRDPDVRENTSFETDGSQRIEYFDFSINDTPNDVVVGPDGTARSVTHYILTRTAACAPIDAAVGKPAGVRCRVL